jgi:hypothetical protein
MSTSGGVHMCIDLYYFQCYRAFSSIMAGIQIKCAPNYLSRTHHYHNIVSPNPPDAVAPAIQPEFSLQKDHLDFILNPETLELPLPVVLILPVLFLPPIISTPFSKAPSPCPAPGTPSALVGGVLALPVLLKTT